MYVWQKLKSQLILLFMGLTVLFGTIHESQCIILTNFYLYLQYFQQNVFCFNEISGFQTDPYVIRINRENVLLKKRET